MPKSEILKNWFQTILTLVILLGITTVIFLYTAGYRLSKNEENGDIAITHTGMISAKSIPEGANVYLDGELKTATNDSIASVKPGRHNLKIVKNGFVTWEKTIEVFPELVTDVTAVLVAQSARLEPLTNTGARIPAISPSLSNLAFFSKDSVSPGVWVIPLTGGTISLFRYTNEAVLEDKPGLLYSNGNSIEWSPDEKMLLIEAPNSRFFVLDLETETVEATASPDVVRQTWLDDLTVKRRDFIEKLDIPSDLREIAVDSETLWAPDNKKFLYTAEARGEIEYRVYNMEKPIPVGENVESVVFKIAKNAEKPWVTWYADSFHLILTEGKIKTDTEGRISLIRIDGTNKTEIYKSKLFSDRVFSTPGGDKLIILTSFKSEGQTDLYTVGVR